jgi:hypothetical protein
LVLAEVGWTNQEEGAKERSAVRSLSEMAVRVPEMVAQVAMANEGAERVGVQRDWREISGE